MLNYNKVHFFLLLIIMPSMAFAQFESNPLSQALDNVEFDFVSNSPGFFSQTTVTNFGGDAAQSQDIGDSEIAIMATEFIDSFGMGGRVTFDWRVSSEEIFDDLRFIIVNENEQVVFERAISGITDWSTVSEPIPAGNHILAWAYDKDSSVSTLVDAGFVDRVVITRNGEPPVPECMTESTELNSALDNSDLNFTDFTGTSPTSQFKCVANDDGVGGTVAVSASRTLSSQIRVDIDGPVDIVFDWQLLSGEDNIFEVQVFNGNQVITNEGNDYFGRLEGPTDKETFRLSIPRNATRFRWVYFDRGNPNGGLIDNVRVENSGVDPRVLSILSSIFLLLNGEEK